MEQLEFFPVPSPCVGVCDADERGYCKGCMRNRDERFNWLKMTPAQQRHVIKLCRQRYRRKLAAGKATPEKNTPSGGQPLQPDLFGSDD